MEKQKVWQPFHLAAGSQQLSDEKHQEDTESNLKGVHKKFKTRFSQAQFCSVGILVLTQAELCACASLQAWGVKVSGKWHHLAVVSCLLVLIHVKPSLVANIWLFPDLCCPRPPQQYRGKIRGSRAFVSVPSHEHTSHGHQEKGKHSQGWVCASPSPLAPPAAPERSHHLLTAVPAGSCNYHTSGGAINVCQTQQFRIWITCPCPKPFPGQWGWCCVEGPRGSPCPFSLWQTKE